MGSNTSIDKKGPRYLYRDDKNNKTIKVKLLAESVVTREDSEDGQDGTERDPCT